MHKTFFLAQRSLYISSVPGVWRKKPLLSLFSLCPVMSFEWEGKPSKRKEFRGILRGDVEKAPLGLVVRLVFELGGLHYGRV